MPQNSTISFSFELKEGANGIKTLTFDAKNLREVLDSTVTEAEKLNDRFINFAAICTGLDSVNKTINDIQNVFKDLTQVYSAQIEVETKLAVNMRNTMGAREEDMTEWNTAISSAVTEGEASEGEKKAVRHL